MFRDRTEAAVVLPCTHFTTDLGMVKSRVGSNDGRIGRPRGGLAARGFPGWRRFDQKPKRGACVAGRITTSAVGSRLGSGLIRQAKPWWCGTGGSAGSRRRFAVGLDQAAEAVVIAGLLGEGIGVRA